ncbi:hypothetical protein NQ318_011743 [Aromia moschata]|uniref:DDE-1 domain-containing protein n=1 Tax=Aromia moschata TaxID=1265417 RepID=A0AAV8Y0Y8_9CUCU|nr:hypothetical protein NQ318_011743 [Aromia moschata]
MQAVQELLEDDPDRRVKFCDLLMTCIDQNQLSLEWIVFSDEATFTLNGHVNRQNWRYWAEENPHWMREARENFVTLLCLPPHTTHKLQPLDDGVMFPFNAYMGQALETWMNNHPGRTVTAFQISSIFREAYLKTGIFPFNPETFTDADFIATEVTDELIEEPSAPVTDNTETSREERQENPIPGPSSRPDTVLDSENRIAKSTGTVILTSTPYKKQLEKERMEIAELEGRKKAKAKARLIENKTVKALKIKNNILSGEGWIQCISCRRWAHDECAGVSDDEENYICTRRVLQITAAPAKQNLVLI